MCEVFIQYIKRHSTVPLTEHEIDLIKSVVVYRKFKRKQHFLYEGDVSKFSAFIIKGAMRQYTVNEKGMEHAVSLFLEMSWAGDRESFMTGAPSPYFVDAWEDTEALLISRTDYLNLWMSIPAIVEMSRSLTDEYSFALQKRLHSFITLSTEERYFNLEKTYPELLQRFPQHIIATYLGISRETLSRIRSHTLKPIEHYGTFPNYVGGSHAA
jgi:CRP-like cAMP-binding protein